MTVSPPISPLVMPVAEYEPPTGNVDNVRGVPRYRQSSHAALRRPTRRAPGQLGDRHPQAATAEVMSPPMRQAALFADAALRRVLEVIDRRRPAAQLRPLLAPSLVDSVLSAGRAFTESGAGQEGAAVLRRMRLQPVGERAVAAEVFGCYSRGDRMHAIACRVEQNPDSRWLVVALHIG